MAIVYPLQTCRQLFSVFKADLALFVFPYLFFLLLVFLARSYVCLCIFFFPACFTVFQVQDFFFCSSVCSLVSMIYIVFKSLLRELQKNCKLDQTKTGKKKKKKKTEISGPVKNWTTKKDHTRPVLHVVL